MQRLPIGRLLRCFLVWMIVFHWWLVLLVVPFLRHRESGIVFAQVMLYVWIPVRLLANQLGPTHFAPVEFVGPYPRSPVGWAIVVSFWAVVSAALAIITSTFIGLFRVKRGSAGKRDSV
jgi:hypothetical protein